MPDYQFVPTPEYAAVIAAREAEERAYNDDIERIRLEITQEVQRLNSGMDELEEGVEQVRLQMTGQQKTPEEERLALARRVQRRKTRRALDRMESEIRACRKTAFDYLMEDD